MTNPLIEFQNQKQFATPHSSVPFSKIKPEHYLPAAQSAFEKTRLAIAKIKASPVSFENTILGLESCSEDFDLATGLFFNMFGAEGVPEIQSLAKDISPLAAAISSEISLDAEIFKAVKEVHDNRANLKLNPEQLRLLDKTYKGFVRNGALLSLDKKELLKNIDQQLSLLSPKFSENVLNATNAFEMWISDKADLAGLPESATEGAAFEAKHRGKEGQWLFTLQAPSLMPFLQYSAKRNLREKLWRASAGKSFGDTYDNQNNVLQTVELRHQRAQLLGFKTHADFVLEERMAENPQKVMSFLDRLLISSRPAAERDLQELKDFAKNTDGITDFKPWDFAYYSEKLKIQKYDFDSEELRPYFPIERVIKGVFDHAQTLYGINFKKRTDVELYHPDVECFEVTDKTTGEYIGLFYTDFFPRATKRGGAWMTSFFDQGLFKGQIMRPHVSIVCNFTKPTATKPSLLTYDEVKTVFHEFGHALHGLLSKCTYRSLSGTNVYWDFVELPSQIMENWVMQKEGLDVFARHYETGEALPAELLKKLLDSDKFMAGYGSLRQVQLATLDMKWHTSDPKNLGSVDDFEKKATEATRLFPVEKGANTSCSFGHIFSGGYSSGYYSYKWAEVLDADAFEYFKEKGIFNLEVATSFKNNILSRGGTEHPMELYKKFRGREPDPNALLRRDGLI